MKKIGLLLSLAVVMMAAVPVGQKELKTQFKTVVEQWGKQAENYQNDYDADQTWLNVGVRSKYAYMKDYLSIGLLETISGEKVFLGDNPHGKHPDYNNKTNFGHYNPEFIMTVYEPLASLLIDNTFKAAAQDIYNQHLQTTARNYYLAYKFLHQEGEEQLVYGLDREWTLLEIQTMYQDVMKGEAGLYDDGAYFLGELFRNYADEKEKEGLDWYEADTAPGFWIRRSIDKTDKQFFALISLIINELDADWDKK